MGRYSELNEAAESKFVWNILHDSFLNSLAFSFLLPVFISFHVIFCSLRMNRGHVFHIKLYHKEH